MAKEGFYSVRYQSPLGWGMAVIALDTGLVIGADVAGGIWDGTYEFNQRTDELDVNLKVDFPPDVYSTVTGQLSDEGITETYELSLPRDLGSERTFNVKVLGADMMVIFKKVRDFPD